MVQLERSNTLLYNQDLYPGIQILLGNVVFRHDNALLFCDSAYFYEQANEESEKSPESTYGSVTADEVSSIDLNLDQTEAKNDFTDDTQPENIWAQPEEDDESDTPAFLRRRKKKKD